MMLQRRRILETTTSAIVGDEDDDDEDNNVEDVPLDVEKAISFQFLLNNNNNNNEVVAVTASSCCDDDDDRTSSSRMMNDTSNLKPSRRGYCGRRFQTMVVIFMVACTTILSMNHIRWTVDDIRQYLMLQRIDDRRASSLSSGDITTESLQQQQQQQQQQQRHDKNETAIISNATTSSDERIQNQQHIAIRTIDSSHIHSNVTDDTDTKHQDSLIVASKKNNNNTSIITSSPASPVLHRKEQRLETTRHAGDERNIITTTVADNGNDKTALESSPPSSPGSKIMYPSSNMTVESKLPQVEFVNATAESNHTAVMINTISNNNDNNNNASHQSSWLPSSINELDTANGSSYNVSLETMAIKDPAEPPRLMPNIANHTIIPNELVMVTNVLSDEAQQPAETASKALASPHQPIISNRHHPTITTTISNSNNNKVIDCWNFEQRCALFRTNDSLVTTTTISPSKHLDGQPRTLALNDPLLRDGYRNQYMRFVTLTLYALEHGFTQMLAPSIRWNCDHRKRRFDSVPIQLLFDMDEWNRDPDLPRMVAYNETEHFDWNPDTGLFRGACEVVDTYLQGDGKNKDIIFNKTSHYQHPVPYGGGVGLGWLFYDYRGFDVHRKPHAIQAQNRSMNFLDIEAKIIRAMRPTSTIERMIEQTLGGAEPPYMALHARVEPEMLIHTMCRNRKVFNLTSILNMIQDMDHDVERIPQNASVYVAIGLKEMQEGNPYRIFQLEHRLNMEALNDIMSNGLDLTRTGRKLNVMASDSQWSDSNNTEVKSCASEIVSSIISFEIAVRAKIFVGTFISSWSYSVWKTRHYLGRGGNFAYTPNGIVNITGVPPPFTC